MPIVRSTIDIVNLLELKVWMGKLKTISLHEPINTNHMEMDTYKTILQAHDGIKGRIRFEGFMQESLGLVWNVNVMLLITPILYYVTYII